MLISHGICQELDQLKHLYNGLPDFLTKIVEEEVARIPRELRYGLASQLWTMLYMPQVSFSAADVALTGASPPGLRCTSNAGDSRSFQA